MLSKIIKKKKNSLKMLAVSLIAIAFMIIQLPAIGAFDAQVINIVATIDNIQPRETRTISNFLLFNFNSLNNNEDEQEENKMQEEELLNEEIIENKESTNDQDLPEEQEEDLLNIIIIPVETPTEENQETNDNQLIDNQETSVSTGLIISE